MMLKALKAFYYSLPFSENSTLYKLRMFVYHHLYQPLITRNYGKILTKTIHGITYELDLSESIEASLYYSGEYEHDTLACLRQYIDKDMIVFEVGANIGSHSFEIAKLLQEGSGTLYCFEPTEYAFTKLMRNNSLNRFHNMVFEKIALSDRKVIEILTPTSSSETTAFTASWDIKGGRSKNRIEQKIVFDTLDHYIRTHDIAHIDIIKVDIDGYEFKFLQGGIQTISDCKPILIMEFSECLLHYAGDRLENLLDLLEGLGYSFQPVYSNETMEKTRIIQEVHERSTLDCICICKRYM